MMRQCEDQKAKRVIRILRRDVGGQRKNATYSILPHNFVQVTI